MAIHSYGYMVDNADQIKAAEDFKLLTDNLDLILENEPIIFNCADYSFCTPAFSYCNPILMWRWEATSNLSAIGLERWSFKELCPNCNNLVLITSFAGSPLTGGNKWTGICLTCRQRQKGRDSLYFKDWMDMV